ncbi:hypothetical protein [Tenacibaculum insulae]|uniref:hypothetical protein n=1 Tax=Tenacibaculum insulae TaxID=2029677 RepID=UPI003AB3DCF6
MDQEVDKKLKELEKLESKIISLGKEMHKNKTFPIDLLANAVLDRSLKLIFGFTTLIRNENYISACHLVRCHLDNILRFSGAWLVENPHTFATEIIKGKQMDKIKDREGNYLKDWYLRNKMNEEFRWVKNVYKETSGFIHLSDKHFFAATKLIDSKENIIELSISKKDININDNLRIEAINGMIGITKILFSYIESWIWTKQNKES